MAIPVVGQQTIRKMLLGLFAITMAMSLACSLSIQHGHADVPVAASANEIRPLRPGQKVRLPADELLEVAENIAPR